MSGLGFSASIVLLVASFVLNALVLAYRWPRLPSVRRRIDALQQRLTRRPDWTWLRLEHILLPLVVLAGVNVLWQVSTLHCGDDSLALLASGQAVLHGQNPFVVDYCGYTAHPIPYGLPAVLLNTLGAIGDHVAGIWIVWEAVALAVVPLVWLVAGEDRRYLTVLAATSVVYLPNLATDIGLDNAIVPVAVLAMLYALEVARRRRGWYVGLAAFLSTARFPAVFPLLGAAGADRRARVRGLAIVIGVFAATVAVSYLLWGWDAIGIVYLGQFSRTSGGSLNFFAVLLVEGWYPPTLASAALQGAALLALVAWVSARGYSTRAASAIPILGVLLLSQYTNFHFFVWLVPLFLLGPSVRAWLLLLGTGAALDTILAGQYLGETLGVWWPYELAGIVLTALLLYLLLRIALDEEARRRSGTFAAVS